MKNVDFVFAFAVVIAVSSFARADEFSPKTDPKYADNGMAQMKPCERGENLPANQRPADYCGHPYVVTYFDLNNPKDEAERDSYRVSIIDGVVYNSDTHKVYPDGDVFFVMDPSGNFYLFEKDGDAPLHHSSFFDGNPIAAGGEMDIEGGHIKKLTMHTGHYEMTEKILENAKEALKDDGVKLQ